MYIQIELEGSSIFEDALEKARPKLEAALDPVTSLSALCFAPMVLLDGKVHEVDRVKLESVDVERGDDGPELIVQVSGPMPTIGELDAGNAGAVAPLIVAGMRFVFSLSVGRIVSTGVPAVIVSFVGVRSPILPPLLLKQIGDRIGPTVAIPPIALPIGSLQPLIGTNPNNPSRTGVQVSGNVLAIRLDYAPKQNAAEWALFSTGKDIRAGLSSGDVGLPTLVSGGVRTIVDARFLTQRLRQRVLAESEKSSELSDVTVDVGWSRDSVVTISISGNVWTKFGTIGFETTSKTFVRMTDPNRLYLRTEIDVDADNWDVLKVGVLTGLTEGLLGAFFGAFGGPAGAAAGFIVGFIGGLIQVIGGAATQRLPKDVGSTGFGRTAIPALPPFTVATMKTSDFIGSCSVSDEDHDREIDCNYTLEVFDVPLPPGVTIAPPPPLAIRILGSHGLSNALVIDVQLPDIRSLRPGPRLSVALSEAPRWSYDDLEVCSLYPRGIRPRYVCRALWTFENVQPDSRMRLCAGPFIIDDPLRQFLGPSATWNPRFGWTWDDETQKGTIWVELWSSQILEAFRLPPYPLRCVLRTTGGVRYLTLAIPPLAEAEIALDAGLREYYEVRCKGKDVKDAYVPPDTGPSHPGGIPLLPGGPNRGGGVDFGLVRQGAISIPGWFGPELRIERPAAKGGKLR